MISSGLRPLADLKHDEMQRNDISDVGGHHVLNEIHMAYKWYAKIA